jgi:hypothetical protein
MHPSIQHELARTHQAELLREAEQHRLALLARPRAERQRRLWSILIQVRRRRPQQRPAPAV